jgi:hypothetical protein
VLNRPALREMDTHYDIEGASKSHCWMIVQLKQELTIIGNALEQLYRADTSDNSLAKVTHVGNCCAK